MEITREYLEAQRDMLMEQKAAALADANALAGAVQFCNQLLEQIGGETPPKDPEG